MEKTIKIKKKCTKVLVLLSLSCLLFLPSCKSTTTREQVQPKNENTIRNKKELWVTSERLHRRTCPSEKCGSVGQLFFREHADNLEERGKWIRTSKYYNASCENGQSKYVDSGNAQCVPANGIKNGQFAEWVLKKYLSKTRPADPGENATGDYGLVKSSDDYSKYKDVFVKSAKLLLSNGHCTVNDFKEMGGWVKSMSHRYEPIYFIYCGGMTLENKIYLDASTGKTFQ